MCFYIRNTLLVLSLVTSSLSATSTFVESPFVTGQELKKVGLVRNSKGSACMGALVGKGVVLTAFHCVKDGLENDKVSVWFVPNGEKVKYGGWASARLGNSWMAYVLHQIPEHLGYFGYTDLLVGDTITLGGYTSK